MCGVTANKKGSLLEDVVALMHEAPGYKVERRKKLPVTAYPSESKREFDVLVSTEVAGCVVRVAISCKNQSEKVGAQTVSDFVDALGQVEIPTRQGIIVSVAGFTSDALESAAARNIRCLCFEGLTEDRLSQEINAALQSTVYLFQSRSVISPFDEDGMDAMGGVGDPSHLGFIYDLDLPTLPTIPTVLNIIWDAWSKGRIPHSIGMHSVVIRQKPHNPRWAIFVSAFVEGLVTSVPGKYQKSALTDARSGAMEKIRVHAEFDVEPKRQSLSRFESAEDLEAFLNQEKLKLVHTVIVPRINSDFGFWPLSKKVADEIVGKIKNGEPVNPADYASTNLLEAWNFDKPYFEALTDGDEPAIQD